VSGDAYGLQREQVLPVVRHDEPRASLERTGHDWIVIGISRHEIDRVGSFDHVRDGSQGSDKGVDLDKGQPAERAYLRLA